jgi:hypothetical protein
MIVNGSLNVEYPFLLCYSTVKCAEFTCPRVKQKVTLQDCLNSDGKGSPCIFYQHWGWINTHPYLSCGYKQEPAPTPDNTKEEEIEEPDTGREYRKRGFELETET